jgi:hypothetical protein
LRETRRLTKEEDEAPANQVPSGIPAESTLRLESRQEARESERHDAVQTSEEIKEAINDLQIETPAHSGRVAHSDLSDVQREGFSAVRERYWSLSNAVDDL